MKEQRVCNTNDCQFNPTFEPVCQCELNTWTCTGQCSEHTSCQRVSPYSPTLRCLPKKNGRCHIFGDPHIHTFDGAQNDVYGVADYILVKYDESDNIFTSIDLLSSIFTRRTKTDSTGGLSWEIRMRTAPIGTVSFLDSLTLIVRSNKVDYNISTYYNKGTEFSFDFADDSITSRQEFERYVKMHRNNGMTSFETDFGLFIKHTGSTAVISLPLAYNGKVKGICGNFDFDKTNDFMCPDGKVWPFAEMTYARSTSEFETAKCWKINGTDGPHPGSIADCPENVVCEEMFDKPLLSACAEKIDISTLIEACKVDFCQDKSIIEDIYAAFIEKCSAVLPTDEAVCTWRDALGFNNCPEKTIWSGCKRKCDAKTCNGSSDCKNNILTEGCFCKEGFVLSESGVCTSVASCKSQWSEWSDCIWGGDDYEGCSGSRKRTRNENGKVVSQEEECLTSHCDYSSYYYDY